MEPEDLEVVKAMKRYGGSFVKALAECCLYADHENLRRLKQAFEPEWMRYREMSKKAPDNAVGAVKA